MYWPRNGYSAPSGTEADWIEEGVSMAITKADAEKALNKTVHPEINSSLPELGMIRDVNVKDSDVSVVLALPFPEIPILDQLVSIIKESLRDISRDVKVETVVMTEAEKQAFMQKAKDGWKF